MGLINILFKALEGPRVTFHMWLKYNLFSFTSHVKRLLTNPPHGVFFYSRAFSSGNQEGHDRFELIFGAHPHGKDAAMLAMRSSWL